MSLLKQGKRGGGTKYLVTSVVAGKNKENREIIFPMI